MIFVNFLFDKKIKWLYNTIGSDENFYTFKPELSSNKVNKGIIKSQHLLLCRVIPKKIAFGEESNVLKYWSGCLFEEQVVAFDIKEISALLRFYKKKVTRFTIVQ